MTASIEADTENAMMDSERLLAFHFEIAVESGYTGDLEDYKLDQEATYAQSDSIPSTTGYQINSIPDGFCKDSVYETLDRA